MKHHVKLVERELLFVKPVSILTLQLLTQMELVISVMLLIVLHAHLGVMEQGQYVKIVWMALN